MKKAGRVTYLLEITAAAIPLRELLDQQHPLSVGRGDQLPDL